MWCSGVQYLVAFLTYGALMHKFWIMPPPAILTSHTLYFRVSGLKCLLWMHAHPLFIVNAFYKEPLSFSLSVSLTLSDTAMPPLLILCFLVCMKVSVCQTRAGFVNIDVHDFYSNLVPFLLALCLSVVLLSCGSAFLSSSSVFLLLFS